MHHRLPLLVVLSILVVSPSGRVVAEEGAYRFGTAETKGARLSEVDGVPLLVVAGTPREIGERTAQLVAQPALELVDFPKRMLEKRGAAKQWPGFLTGVQVFRPNVPPRYLEEMQAFCRVADVGVDRLLAANVMPDVYRAFGCSSLIVHAEHSATEGPLFGRNLDFFTLGTLHRYSFVSVVRPEGKHAFVSVGFPGLVGVLSGMNEKGLALAVHEVHDSKDDSAMINWFGVPYAMTFRRVLEECETVAEARELIASLPRTTKLNLSLCDRETSGVVEFTPRSVALRPASNGFCICTNHFRTDALCTTKECKRFDTLEDAIDDERVGLAEMKRRLNAVHQGKLTLQSMIFEPATLKVHVSLTGQPSSKGPYKTLELAELLRADAE